MTSERLIAEGTLANFWHVHPHTLIGWRTHGYLTADAKEQNHGEGSIYYKLSTIERLHAQDAVGFGNDIAIPPVAKLLTSPHGLLTVNDIMERLHEERHTVLRRLRYGMLPGFTLGPTGKVVRFPATSLAYASEAPEGLIHPEVARRVLCLRSQRTIHSLGASGALRRQRMTGRGMTQFVERESLMELLATLIPPFVTPQEWWEWTLNDDKEAVDITHIVKQHRIAHRTLMQLIDEGDTSFAYIRTIKGGSTRLPEWAVRRFVEARGPIAPDKLGLIFGADEATVAKWTTPTTRFCQRRHGKAYFTCPSMQCVLAYIDEHRTTQTVLPQEWVARATQDGAAPVLTSTLADDVAGSDEHYFEEYVIANNIDAVRMPDGQLSVVRPDAIAIRRLSQRQLSPDYRLGLGE